MCMFPCITPVSAHFWPPLEKGPLSPWIIDSSSHDWQQVRVHPDCLTSYCCIVCTDNVWILEVWDAYLLDRLVPRAQQSLATALWKEMTVLHLAYKYNFSTCWPSSCFVWKLLPVSASCDGMYGKTIQKIRSERVHLTNDLQETTNCTYELACIFDGTGNSQRECTFNKNDVQETTNCTWTCMYIW